MYGQGHYYCQRCGHAVYASRGGCGTCMTPLSRLMLMDTAMDQQLVGMDDFGQPTIGFDPFDGQIAFNLGDGLAIEPDGQLDMNIGGFDIPI